MSTKWASSRQSGFTLVELLIVIVVIAILAAITIVVYNGVQERAQSAAIISQAEAYAKGIKLWYTDLGTVPTPASCIAPSTYTTCPSVPGWGSNEVNDATFEASLAQYSGVPVPQLGKYGSNANPVGLMFYHNNWYGMNRAILGYQVGPNTDCGLGPILASDHKTYAPAGQNYTLRTSDRTQCEIEVIKY